MGTILDTEDLLGNTQIFGLVDWFSCVKTVPIWKEGVDEDEVQKTKDFPYIFKSWNVSTAYLLAISCRVGCMKVKKRGNTPELCHE